MERVKGILITFPPRITCRWYGGSYIDGRGRPHRLTFGPRFYPCIVCRFPATFRLKLHEYPKYHRSADRGLVAQGVEP
jgi:hypothetical protein